MSAKNICQLRDKHPLVVLTKQCNNGYQICVTFSFTVSLFCGILYGNFREGFIFAYFMSQEPFAKIKTAKFLLSTCKVSESHFNLAYFSHPNSNRSLLASVSLKPSREPKCYVSTDARTRWRCKNERGCNRFYEHPGYEATFLATQLAISLCKQF